jgi:hypothetical protein
VTNLRVAEPDLATVLDDHGFTHDAVEQWMAATIARVVL